MKSKYLEILLTQFIDAKGIKDIDMNSKEFLRDFVYWLEERKRSGEKFLSYVDETGYFKYRCYNVAEVGKGYLDSLVLDKDISLITPYTRKIDDSKIVIPEVFALFDILIGESEQKDTLAENDIRGFVTHNPYDYRCLLNWSWLHNSCNGNIAVGFFGDIHDKDIEAKKEMFEKLRDRLNFGTYTDEYFEDGNSYYYNLVSNKRVKYEDRYKELIRRLH